MKVLAFSLITLSVLLFLGLFACWALTIWQGDLRWGETSQVLIVPCLVSGFGGGIAWSYR